MLTFIFALIERFRARVAAATLDVEVGLIIKHAERRAVLLRLASRYEAEGLATVAAEVRQRAEAISFQCPLASLFSSVEAPANELHVSPQNGVATHGEATPVLPAPGLVHNRRKAR